MPRLQSRRWRHAALAPTLLITVAAAFLTGTHAADAAGSHSRTHYETYIANKVLGELNKERAAHHLGKVHMNAHLLTSARSHNVSMSRANSMSHQVRGEAVFTARLHKAGYDYRYAGENIGYNTRANTAGVLMLERIMYAERPPNDGHRRNILDRHFAEIGIDVYLDPAHRKVWLTEDFGHR